jgi:Protein of unknown function (DUF3179)
MRILLSRGDIRRAMTPLVIGAAILIALAGCSGGAEERAEPGARGERRAVEGPPPELAAGWETDFSQHSVSFSQFQSGGPPRDGIPPIDDPKFLPVTQADFLSSREPVIELELGGAARAYPLQILTWHEIVNDDVGGTPVAVTFCPLCNTAIVFDRRVDGRTLDFGTTGMLRNSDLVMYDRQTESWWQQFGGEALVGELTGTELEQLPSRIVAWAEFRSQHPDGRVLSRHTGHERPYGENPYSGYDSVDSPPFFPAERLDDDRLPPKERVVFVQRGDDAVAVPFSTLAEKRELRVEVGGDELVFRWRPGVASALDSASIPEGRDVGAAEVLLDGELAAFDQPFWFAVAAFRPDVRIVR